MNRCHGGGLSYALFFVFSLVCSLSHAGIVDPYKEGQTFEGQIEATKAELPALISLYKELILRFPPNKYHYVGIGRSATPLLAMAEVFAKADVSFVPSSNVAKTMWGSIADYPPVASDSLINEEKIRAPFVKKLFSEYLPNPGSHHKKMLVIDYINLGGSVEYGSHYTRLIYEEKDCTKRSRIQTLVLSDNPYQVRRYMNYEKSSTLPYHLMSLIDEGRYLSTNSYAMFAPYGYFDIKKISTLPFPKKQRPEYARYKEYLAKTVACEILL